MLVQFWLPSVEDSEQRYVHHNYSQKKPKKLADQTPREIWPVRRRGHTVICLWRLLSDGSEGLAISTRLQAM